MTTSKRRVKESPNLGPASAGPTLRPNPRSPTGSRRPTNEFPRSPSVNSTGSTTRNGNPAEFDPELHEHSEHFHNGHHHNGDSHHGHGPIAPCAPDQHLADCCCESQDKERILIETFEESIKKRIKHEFDSESSEKIELELRKFLVPGCGFEDRGNVNVRWDENVHFLECIFQKLTHEILEGWKTTFLFPTIKVWLGELIAKYVIELVQEERRSLLQEFEKKLEKIRIEHAKEIRRRERCHKNKYAGVIKRVWAAYEKSFMEVEITKEVSFSFSMKEERRMEWLEIVQDLQEDLRDHVPHEFDVNFRAEDPAARRHWMDGRMIDNSPPATQETQVVELIEAPE